MKFKKTLKTILLSIALGLSGCGSSPEVSAFKDINGDGKPDMNYFLYNHNSGSPKYWVYVKYNKGDGNFGEPILLYKSQSYPNTIPKMGCMQCDSTRLRGEYY